MFTHVLLPLDLSAKNERALTVALAMAAQNRARVTLLHIVQRVEHISLGEMRSFYDRLREQAEQRLARAERRFVAKGLEAKAVVLVGDPPRDIVRYAETKRVDLIVINSHKVLDMTRPAQDLGTTSYKVAILCRCPVMLVK